MKTLTIGSTSINITECTRMRDLKRGFYLEIKIPEDTVNIDELKTIFKDNKQTIAITEADGTTNLYEGFQLLSTLSLEDGFYYVCQACTSEIEAQLSIAQNTINAQAQIIESQAQQVTSLEEATVVQMATIDNLLLDVIPAVIADAVTAAVADALASNSTTPEVVE